MSKLHHLTRIDNGWWVRVQREPARISKFFADSSHGGNRRALAAATAARDAFLKRHPAKPKPFRLCACGCGTRIRRRHPSGRLQAYVAGHRAPQ